MHNLRLLLGRQGHEPVLDRNWLGLDPVSELDVSGHGARFRRSLKSPCLIVIIGIMVILFESDHAAEKAYVILGDEVGLLRSRAAGGPTATVTG